MIPISDSEYGSASIDISSGSLKITHTFSGYRFGRREGVISSYKPTLPGSAKTYEMIITEDKKTSYCVEEGDDSGDDYDDGLGFAGGLSGSGMIAIAVISEPTPAGNPTYEFMEVYSPYAVHHIDVIHDGEHGTSQNVDVRGGLKGINDDDYSDVLMYPMTKNAIKYTPMFKRERLLRESMILVIDGIQVVEVKWYQKGIFQVLFMVVAAVVGCLLTACTTVALLIAGNTAAWTALGTYVLTTVAAALVMKTVLSMIDNPLLAALMVVAGAILFGSIDTTNMMQMATLAVEATGTYVQKKAIQDMLKLKEEMKEFRRMANKKMRELDNKLEEAGVSLDVQDNFALNKMTMPPPGEAPEDFFERVLNRDLAIIEQRPDLDEKRMVERALNKF